MQKNKIIPLRAPNSNLVYLNPEAQAYHETVQKVRANVDAPLFEVWCQRLMPLPESANAGHIMTKEACDMVQGRAEALNVDFYARPVTADEATVRCHMPLTSEDIISLLYF